MVNVVPGLHTEPKNESRPQADPGPARGRLSPDPGASTPGTSARGQRAVHTYHHLESMPITMWSHKCETASASCSKSGNTNPGRRALRCLKAEALTSSSARLPPARPRYPLPPPPLQVAPCSVSAGCIPLLLRGVCLFPRYRWFVSK